MSFRIVLLAAVVGASAPHAFTLTGPPVPDSTLSCAPSSLTINQGAGGNTTCTVTSVQAFSAAVDLSCANLPPGVTCAYHLGRVTPPPNGTATDVLYVTVSASVPSGSYTFQAVGTSGALTHSFPISIIVVTVAVEPHALELDTAGNGVLEPGAAVMCPTWRNIRTGPGDTERPRVELHRSSGSLVRDRPPCDRLPHPAGRPGAVHFRLLDRDPQREPASTHRDATILERWGPAGRGRQNWTLHIGGSFTDSRPQPLLPFRGNHPP